MIGMNALTGDPMTMDDHLRQSIEDILNTPIGARVMRRTYGSGLFALVDAPMDAVTVLDIIQETAGAIGRWEPRVAVERVSVTSATPGELDLDIDLHWVIDRRPLRLEGIRI